MRDPPQEQGIETRSPEQSTQYLKIHRRNIVTKVTRESIENEYAEVKATLDSQKWENFVRVMLREPEVDAYQTQQRLEQRKKDAGQDFFNRKDALILRRVKANKRENEFCSEDEALAYVKIHEMKKAKEVGNGTYQERMKIEVTDEDIAAFLELEGEGRFYKDISLEMISTKVADTEGGGGDNQGEEVITPAA